jgi:hypothetical protein
LLQKLRRHYRVALLNETIQRKLEAMLVSPRTDLRQSFSRIKKIGALPYEHWLIAVNISTR